MSTQKEQAMNHIRNTALVLVAATAVYACTRDERPTPNTGVGAPGYTPPAPEDVPSRMSNDQVVRQVAEERCKREQRCGEIGPNEDYASLESCRVDMYASTLDDLGLDECPGGIDNNDLQMCLTEIRNEDCDNPMDSFERVAACRSGMLCID
jgi:hypothetical protein